MIERSLVPVVLVMNDSYWLPYSLEASRGYFSRYVIYDMGSKDNTRQVIDWFIDSCKGLDIEFYVRSLPELPPSVQGITRNSMIAEARAARYFILDADEIYTTGSYDKLWKLNSTMEDYPGTLYGVVRRIEMNMDLTKAWGLDKQIPHHRLYSRNAIWKGPHPGEAPLYNQTRENTLQDFSIECFHFHGTERSPNDSDTPKRIERRNRPTYQPGDLKEIDILDKLPILRKPIANFEPNRFLKELQASYAKTR